MADLSESSTTRLLPPAAFRGHLTHQCYAGCGQVMVVPDANSPAQAVEDGDIWACGRCGTPHEYYLVYGVRGQRSAMVRALRGLHAREGYEPPIGEFVR